MCTACTNEDPKSDAVAGFAGSISAGGTVPGPCLPGVSGMGEGAVRDGSCLFANIGDLGDEALAFEDDGTGYRSRCATRPDISISLDLMRQCPRIRTGI